MDRPSVTRYVGTYINRDGMRTLMTPCQGRHTFATADEAQAWINAVTTDNGGDTIRQVWGDNPGFEVCPVPCYQMQDGSHGDPQTRWFD